MKVRLVLALLLLAPICARAQSAAPSIEIVDAWARAAVGTTGAVYLTIKNAGTADDRLEGASTPVADMAQPHVDLGDAGVMRMLPLNAIDAKAGSTVTLKPGGIHLMLTGLHALLKEGARFPITLVFAKAGTINLTVIVGKAGAMGPALNDSHNP
jgi:hypothetical protein